MTIDDAKLILNIQEILSAVIAVMSFIFFRRRQREVKLIGLTFLISYLAGFALRVLPLRGHDVNFAGATYGIVSFITISLLFDVALNGRYRKVFIAVDVVYTILASLNVLFLQKNDINTYSYILSAVIFVIYSIVYFYRLLVDLPAQHLHRVPMFWFNSAMLIYNAGTLFLFLFTNYLVEVLHNDLVVYWSFHNIMNIIQHVVIMMGLWQDLRNIKLRSSSPSAP